MRPLELSVLDSGRIGRGECGTLMLVNTTRVGAHYLRQLLTRDRLSVRSKTAGGSGKGKSLHFPVEIWCLILGDILRPTGTAMNGKREGYCSQDSFSWAQVMSASNLRLDGNYRGSVLHCRKVELDGVRRCGWLENQYAVCGFESWLHAPRSLDRSKVPKVAHRRLKDDFVDGWVSGRRKGKKALVPRVVPVPAEDRFATLDILLLANEHGSHLPASPGCLHWSVEAGDVISRREGGKCQLCRSATSWIRCLACSVGESFAVGYEARHGLGSHCPLCLGPRYTKRSLLLEYSAEWLKEKAYKAVWDEWQKVIDSRQLVLGHDLKA